VIFDKSVFPFASLHSNAGARYTSDVLLISSGNNDDTNLTNDPARSLFPTDSTVPAFVHQPLPRIVVPDQVPGRLPPATVEIPTEPAGPSDWMQVPVSSYAPTDVRHASMQPQVLSPTMSTTSVLTRLADLAVPPPSTSVPPTASKHDLASDPAPDVAPAPSVPLPITLVPRSSSETAPVSSMTTALVQDLAPPRTPLQAGIRKPKIFLWNSSLCLFC
jgi:hypothetical protein